MWSFYLNPDSNGNAMSFRKELLVRKKPHLLITASPNPGLKAGLGEVSNQNRRKGAIK